AGAGRFRLSAENIPYTEERPGGPFRPDQRRSAILEKVPNALFRHAEGFRSSGCGSPFHGNKKIELPQRSSSIV
ncbi:MAG: hypothetical protein IJB81_11925, partial [Clostridia bacterium]|nr:hypothetical protein [Clostridia bacterium]